MTDSFPTLSLIQRWRDSREDQTVEVNVYSFQSGQAGVSVTLAIRYGETYRSYREEHSDLLSLAERVRVSALTVLSYGLGGKRGRDYDLLTAGGQPWPVLGHLKFKDETD